MLLVVGAVVGTSFSVPSCTCGRWSSLGYLWFWYSSQCFWIQPGNTQSKCYALPPLLLFGGVFVVVHVVAVLSNSNQRTSTQCTVNVPVPLFTKMLIFSSFLSFASKVTFGGTKRFFKVGDFGIGQTRCTVYVDVGTVLVSSHGWLLKNNCSASVRGVGWSWVSEPGE